MQKPITIVGGGIAGLSLGIRLVSNGVPTTVVDSDHYPRHKVCGEYLNGRGARQLVGLGILDRLCARGARFHQDAVFYFGDRGSPKFKLPEKALCVSRWVLDECLASRFLELGGELKLGQRWMDSFDGDGIVRATGRRPSANAGEIRIIGIKAHASNVVIESGLELYFDRDRYVGLAQIENDLINVSGLFWAKKGFEFEGKSKLGILVGGETSAIGRRLKDAVFDEKSIKTVAALDLKPTLSRAEELSIGDSYTMIPPLTGNGMSMAIEAGGSVAPLLVDYSMNPSQSWAATRQNANRFLDSEFKRRLRFAWWMQRALMNNALGTIFHRAICLSPGLLRFFYRSTRY
jgi:flavin-dependent dehydrogenase